MVMPAGVSPNAAISAADREARFQARISCDFDVTGPCQMMESVVRQWMHLN
jgi:hypothetical protein